jgi:hypothetical protein
MIIQFSPHTFCHNWVSSIMIPSLLTPTLGWLSRLTSKRRPPKAEILSLSLKFWWVAFWCPKQRNQPRRLQTHHQALAVDPWEVSAPRFGGRHCPTYWERGQSRWRVGWRRLILVVVCCGGEKSYLRIIPQIVPKTSSKIAIFEEVLGTIWVTIWGSINHALNRTLHTVLTEWDWVTQRHHESTQWNNKQFQFGIYW